MAGPKAVVVTPSLPSSVSNDGGGSVFVEHLLRALANQGWEVTVLAPLGSQCAEVSTPTVRIIPILRTWGYLWGLRGEFDPQDRLADLRCIESEQRNAHLLIFIDRPVPEAYQVPTILIIQAVAYWEALSAVLTNHQDAIWVPSNYAAAVVAYITGGCCAESSVPIEVVPPPVEFPPPVHMYTRNRPDTPLRLTSPHRLDWSKGHLEAVALVARLRDSGRDAQLYVPAKGHKRMAQFIDYVHAAGVEEFVHIHSWVPRAKVPAYLGSMNWTLSLGYVPESFGLTVAESLVCTTPVVARPRGAVPEFSAFGNALVLSDTHDDWIAALGNTPTREERLAHAYRIFDRFNPDRFLARVSPLFNVAVGSRPFLPRRTCSCDPPWGQGRDNDFRAWSRTQNLGG